MGGVFFKKKKKSYCVKCKTNSTQSSNTLNRFVSTGQVLLTGQVCVTWIGFCKLDSVLLTGQCCVNWTGLCYLDRFLLTGQCCVNWTELC